MTFSASVFRPRSCKLQGPAPSYRRTLIRSGVVAAIQLCARSQGPSGLQASRILEEGLLLQERLQIRAYV
jgi:hypothetical protein